MEHRSFLVGVKKLSCMSRFAASGHRVDIQLTPPINPPTNPLMKKPSHPFSPSTSVGLILSPVDSMPLSEPICLEKMLRAAYSKVTAVTSVQGELFSFLLT